MCYCISILCWGLTSILVSWPTRTCEIYYFCLSLKNEFCKMYKALNENDDFVGFTLEEG